MGTSGGLGLGDCVVDLIGGGIGGWLVIVGQVVGGLALPLISRAVISTITNHNLKHFTTTLVSLAVPSGVVGILGILRGLRGILHAAAPQPVEPEATHRPADWSSSVGDQRLRHRGSHVANEPSSNLSYTLS